MSFKIEIFRIKLSSEVMGLIMVALTASSIWLCVQILEKGWGVLLDVNSVCFSHSVKGWDSL